MSTAIVETVNLIKSYTKQNIAVNGLNLTVLKGEVYGFLGPNGAGKTTTLKMLLGLVRPTSGTCTVLGHQPGSVEQLKKVGAMIEMPAFYPYLSGKRNLNILAKYSNIPPSRVDAVLDQVELTKRAEDKFENYSLGMKQRLGIAATLLKDPELLILDEPTNGLDPKGVAEMRTLIRSLGHGERTVLLSSHMLGEVEQICDRVGVIQHGKLVAEGTVAELRGKKKLLVRVDQIDKAKRLLEEMNGIEQVEVSKGVLLLKIDISRAGEVTHKLVMNGLMVSELREMERSLEEIFLELTN
jgi:ABC-type multidrug transport system ATPase subunit